MIGKPVSLPYIDLTLDVMKRFGVSVDHDGYRNFRIEAGQKYRARNMTIEGDVSSASYFWAAAAVTCGTAITENIYPESTKQGISVFWIFWKKWAVRFKEKTIG